MAVRKEVAGKGQEVAGDLILDEELHQVLRELYLLGQAVIGQVQELLELWLYLHDQDSKERALQLHRSKSLGKLLLLRRQRLDSILEFLGSWDRRQFQRDFQLILILIKLVDFIDLQLQVDKKVNGKISGSVSGLLVHRISWLLHGVGQPLTGNGHTERGCHGSPS